MNGKVAVDNRSCGVIAHATTAQIVAAADSGEARAAPCFCGSHATQYRFRFAFHPVRQSLFINPFQVGELLPLAPVPRDRRLATALVVGVGGYLVMGESLTAGTLVASIDSL